MEFNFDEWASLYEKDPDAFEKKRIEIITGMIEEAPVHLRDGLKARFKRLQILSATHKNDPVLRAKIALNAAIESAQLLAKECSTLDSLLSHQNPSQEGDITCGAGPGSSKRG